MDRDRLSSDPDDLTSTLLASAQADEPSAAAYAKVAAALGVSLAPAALVSLAPAAVVRAASRLSLPAALKGIGLLLTVGGLIGGALLYRSHVAAKAAGQLASNPPAPRVVVRGAQVDDAKAAAASPAPISAGRALETGATVANATLGPSGVEPAPEAAAPAAVSASPATTPDPVSMRLRPASAAKVSAAQAIADPPKPAVVSTLSEQVMALDRVRVALGARRPIGALNEIASYRAHYPKGVFLIEASVLEIEALAQSGQRNLAASRAQAFLAAHPDSPHAARLRALLPSQD
ncbi:MAG TPA: hypothetical protein VGI10_02495 [Polyangiaceae bacterium]